MNTSTPAISVIIPIYQHWELTEGLFKALDAQSLPKAHWECFIVDNGSETVPPADSLPDFVTLLECPTPGSYAARNKALPLAKGELLVFTDADCQPDPDWLERIWANYQSQREPTLIAGGVTVKRFTPGKPNAIEIYDMAMGLPQDRYIQRGFAVTANLSIPRAVFDQVGSFNDQRFSGGDVEFCIRARDNKIPLVYLPEANVNHPTRSSWDELSTKLKRVKGGQLLSGAPKDRRKAIIQTITPPLRSALYAATTHKVSTAQKFTTLAVMTCLWILNIKLTVQVLLSGERERR